MNIPESTFDSYEDAKRFLKWYNKPGQIVSEWDTYRYRQAKLLLNPPPQPELDEDGTWDYFGPQDF